MLTPLVKRQEPNPQVRTEGPHSHPWGSNNNADCGTRFVKCPAQDPHVVDGQYVVTIITTVSRKRKAIKDSSWLFGQ